MDRGSTNGFKNLGLWQEPKNPSKVTKMKTQFVAVVTENIHNLSGVWGTFDNEIELHKFMIANHMDRSSYQVKMLNYPAPRVFHEETA